MDSSSSPLPIITTVKPIQNPLPLTPIESPSPSPSPSPLKKSRTRLSDRLEMATDESPEPSAVKRRGRTRTTQINNARKPRKPRSSEAEIREENNKDAVAVTGLIEEIGKPRKRKGRPKKEKPNLVQPSISSPRIEEENGVDFDRIGQLVSDLVMWKDVSKSTFWFGIGSLCLLSSCFSQGFNFSIVSAMSQLAILILGVSFLSNSISQSETVEEKCYVKLKEDDVLRLARLILPALNFAISKTRVLFSGEPSMTLKVIPFLLLGAEFGHLITIRRLCAIGFFVSFTVPKLYSCYTSQIDKRAEGLKLLLLDTWCACTHKKKVMTFILLTFWNLSSIKTRIFTAFMLLVLFRYLKQHVVQQLQDGEAQVGGEKEQQKESVVAAETEEKETQLALVVLNSDSKKES
ncbi:reticulon-like protein B17 [Trifolium pratense]|uniref:reticulon-like protein B17 n=1 Tax=Trifolium pratense TaxID=57577 RepID=UPI001E695E9F|nr:reticulon-like protein B17 [Trifolium pratense]